VNTADKQAARYHNCLVVVYSHSTIYRLSLLASRLHRKLLGYLNVGRFLGPGWTQLEVIVARINATALKLVLYSCSRGQKRFRRGWAPPWDTDPVSPLQCLRQ